MKPEGYKLHFISPYDGVVWEWGWARRRPVARFVCWWANYTLGLFTAGQFAFKAHP